MIADAVKGCHGAYKLYAATALAYQDAVETWARSMKIEQEAGHGEAFGGTRAEQEQTETPK